MNYIKIDKTIKKALYLQIKDSIEEAIQSGVLSDNDRLPTESELCEVFGISDIVVKNAYKLLVKQGLILRVQGSGTFVSTRKVYRFPLKGFDKLSHFASFNYTTKEKRVIMFDQASGDEKIVDALHLSQNESYMVSKYVVLIDNAEVLLQTIYLPEKYFPKLSIYDIERHNIKELVTKRYSYTMKKVKNGFSPVNLSSSEALLLNTYKHAAAHRVRTTMLTDDDKPLLYIETLFLGQFTQFEVIMG
jgi:DNA-binding GntR family transcriptional regulator